MVHTEVFDDLVAVERVISLRIAKEGYRSSPNRKRNNPNTLKTQHLPYSTRILPIEPYVPKFPTLDVYSWLHSTRCKWVRMLVVPRRSEW
jgi:hypothetical protein